MGLCINLVELFASTRLLHCQVCNPRVKIVTVVCRCLAFFVVSVCCLLFESSRWGVISIGSNSSFGCTRLICNLIRG